MRSLPAAAAIAALLALAGCSATGTKSGSKSFTGPAKDVAQTVSDLSTAANKRDGKTICTQILSEALQQKLAAGGSSCQAKVDDQLKDSDLATLATQSVNVNGNKATAVVTSQFYGKDKPRTLTFVRGTGGAWRISGISQ